MMLNQLLQVFKENAERDVIIWNGRPYNYRWLDECIYSWRQTIKSRVIPRGSVVALEADFSPNVLALFLALADHRCLILPLTQDDAQEKEKLKDLARAEFTVHVDEKDKVRIVQREAEAREDIYWLVWQIQHPGLILMISDGAGEPVAVVHDLKIFGNSYRAHGHRRRTIALPHLHDITGIHILFDTMRHGGCLVTTAERSLNAVLDSLRKFRADCIPASSAFLQKMLADTNESVDTSSLNTIMHAGLLPGDILRTFTERFPMVAIVENHHSAELGVFPVQQLSGDGAKVNLVQKSLASRVVDGALQVKTDSMMIGYLNGPNPLTEDGWLRLNQLAGVEADAFALEQSMAAEGSVVKVKLVEEDEDSTAVQSIDSLERGVQQ